MTKTLKATAVIEGKDRTSAAFRSAARNAEAMKARMSAINAVMHANQKLQSGAVQAVSTVAAGLGAQKSLKRFAETERGMTRVGITGEATAEQVNAATSALRELSADTAQPFDKIVAGMNALVSSGMRFEDAMKTIPAIAKVAQATGSDMAETATTADAAMQHMGIKAEGTAKAFDSLAASGKAGKFEFKEMARYLPSILPAAKALGYTGQEGLERVAALLQTIRAGTGTSEEAATALSNIFQKMESEETANKFKKMGVDLRKEMAQARKNGDDLVQSFLKISDKALKGDLSKLPQLIGDLQFGTGVRSLSQLADKYTEVRAAMQSASGTIDTDFKRVMNDTQAQVDKTTESFDRLTGSVGSLMAIAFNKSGASDMLRGLASTADQKSDEVSRHGIKALFHRNGALDKTDQEKQGLEFQKQGEALIQKQADVQRELNNLIARRDSFEKKNTRSSAERVSDLNQQIAEKTKEVAALETTRQVRLNHQPHVVDQSKIAPEADPRDEGNRFRNTPRQSSPVPKADVAVKETGRRVVTPVPVKRPVMNSDFSSAAETGFGDDGMAKFREDAEKAQKLASQIKIDPSTITTAAGGMETLSVKAGETKDKAAAVVSEVTKIGPAGAAAGAAAGAGAEAFKSKWMDAIATVKAGIAGIGSAATGARFNTGASSAGSE